MAQGSRPANHRRQTSKTSTVLGSERPERNGPQSAGKRQTADDATILFIKRALCARPVKAGTEDEAAATDLDTKPLEEVLPPLTSQPELDVQLYAIIAIILNQFVRTWYTKITPDGDFVDETVHIIAHCTRGLEDRIRHADLEALLLDEVPAVLDDHLKAVHIARHSSYDHNGAITESQVRAIYHALRPCNALSPPPTDEATVVVQQENEIDWSQLLVSAIMPLLLPNEDLINPGLKVLVSEIFSEMIVRNAILGKTSEPWLLWEGVTKAIYTLKPNVRPSSDASTSPTSRLQRFGLVSTIDATNHGSLRGSQRGPIDATVWAFWSTLQYIAIAWALLRAFVTALMQVPSVEPRHIRVSQNPQPSNKLEAVADGTTARPSGPETLGKRPIVSMRIWSCTDRLISLDERMPWLSGCLSLLQWMSQYGPWRVCRTDSALDRLMSAQIHDRLLNPVLLPPILQSIRTVAFPHNALAPPRVPPTSDEIVEIKRECARAIVECLPETIRMYYFATKQKTTVQEDVEETLDLFSNAYINKHLIVAVLELLVVRLFPELARQAAAD